MLKLHCQILLLNFSSKLFVYRAAISFPDHFISKKLLRDRTCAFYLIFFRKIIDKFLKDSTTTDESTPGRRKLTVADATTDYAVFLLDLEDASPEKDANAPDNRQAQRNSELIDEFIENKPGRIVLQDTPEYMPEPEEQKEETAEEDYFTETLAKIYIKQGRYEKAIEIIRKLHLLYPKKNRYFADQIRFLQKLIINNKNKP